MTINLSERGEFLSSLINISTQLILKKIIFNSRIFVKFLKVLKWLNEKFKVRKRFGMNC